MGLGDNLMAAGLARGAAAKGKRVAFGDGLRILWDQHSAAIFQENPNIAPPGSEGAADLTWVRFYKGHRIYNTRRGNRWVWNYNFRASPGEMFFTTAEKAFAENVGRGFVIIEPNVAREKSVARNKQWPVDRYQAVADRLRKDGHRLVQFSYGGKYTLAGVEQIRTPSFRHALAVMANARRYIGPEGGLHHGAAALGVPGVVIFGGFVPPEVTGYELHSNLTGGAKACGSLRPCSHCRAAMDAISVEDVMAGANAKMKAFA